MPISSWPITAYPREKLLTRGVKSLSDAELLAIFINNRIKNKAAIDLANILLNHFGGIRNLFDANEKELWTAPDLPDAILRSLRSHFKLHMSHVTDTTV